MLGKEKARSGAQAGASGLATAQPARCKAVPLPAPFVQGLAAGVWLQRSRVQSTPAVQHLTIPCFEALHRQVSFAIIVKRNNLCPRASRTDWPQCCLPRPLLPPASRGARTGGAPRRARPRPHRHPHRLWRQGGHLRRNPAFLQALQDMADRTPDFAFCEGVYEGACSAHSRWSLSPPAPAPTTPGRACRNCSINMAPEVKGSHLVRHLGGATPAVGGLADGAGLRRAGAAPVMIGDVCISARHGTTIYTSAA